VAGSGLGEEIGVLKAYVIADSSLQEIEGDLRRGDMRKAKWLDLYNASEDEKCELEKALDVELSPINDYEPFQVSSHYSATDRQLTMTDLVLTFPDDNDPHLLKVTFVRCEDVLITVSDGRSGLSALVKECENCFTHKSGRDDIFAAFLDMIVDHSDNILDKVGHDLDRINT
jgi:magnesium transporter